jgi:hypothetical protein
MQQRQDVDQRRPTNQTTSPMMNITYRLDSKGCMDSASMITAIIAAAPVISDEPPLLMIISFNLYVV